MKEHYLAKLRDQNTTMLEFRRNAEELTLLLAAEAAKMLSLKPVSLKTPLAQTTGQTLSEPPALVSILRSGLAMLPPFLQLFPDAPIGFFGMKRDEKTFQPHLYYENLPPIKASDKVFLLDPMLATGGSAALALQKLCEKGVRQENIVFVGIVGSKQGLALLNQKFPRVHKCLAAVDEKLNDRAYIVPGLGDFGDRFFGTLH